MARTAPIHLPPLAEVRDADHALAAGTVLLGLVGLTLVALDAPRAGVLLGAVGMVVGLAAQMLSRTRAERFVDMAGLLACFLALATGAAEGGLG